MIFQPVPKGFSSQPGKEKTKQKKNIKSTNNDQTQSIETREFETTVCELRSGITFGTIGLEARGGVLVVTEQLGSAEFAVR